MNKSHFEKQKNASLSHQLIKAGRLIKIRGLDSVRSIFNLPELKQSHLDLFAYIEFEGTSISKIAQSKGVSKQSVSKLVKEMIELNLLLIKTDPRDSRSKIVYFKTSGFYSIQKGFEALISIDQQIEAQIGEVSYQAMLDNLSGLIDDFQFDEFKSRNCS